MEKHAWWKGHRGEWYVVVQFILFGLLFAAPRLLPTTAWPAPWAAAARVAGVGLGLVGAALIAGGLLHLGSNLTAVPHPKDDAVLVRHGSYRIVRHPIYSGIVFGAFGYGLLQTNWPALVVAAALLLFFDLKTRREESALLAKFPDYAHYRSGVRKLIPFIY